MKAQKQFYVANWKMNWDFDETVTFITQHYDDFRELGRIHPESQIVLCPSSIALAQAAAVFQDSGIMIGGQDCADHHKGAFTGQVSAEQIKTAGGAFCIIGHSEQRKYAGSTNVVIAHKCEQAFLADLTPILCIGETKEQLQQGKTSAVLEEQLKSIVDLFAPKTYLLHDKQFLIAYEPVWAIGTNSVPTQDHLDFVYGWLSNFIKKQLPVAQIFLLYGGSVSPQTIKEIKHNPLINGFLVGGASLDFQEFKKIVECT